MAELVNQILTFLTDLGYWGIMLGLMIEIIPSEIVLAYGGYLISIGKIPFVEAVVFGVIGGTIAQIFVYWIGRYGGRPFLRKYGKYILIHDKHIDMAEAWFKRYGTGVIFTARFIPVVRHAISVPAGIARMSLFRFTLYTALAIIPWSILFIYLGMKLGDNWREIDDKAGPYVHYFVWASVILTVLYLAYKLLGMKKKRREATGSFGAAGEKAVAHQLRFLGKEYRVFHRRLLEAGGDRQEIDHLVVGPNGVFHIETKHWAGRISFTDQGVERDQGRHAEDPTAQLYRHEYIVKELLRQHHMNGDVVGILCFSNRNGQVKGHSPAFHTVQLDRLVHFIRSYQPKHPLSDRHVRQIGEAVGAGSRSRR